MSNERSQVSPSTKEAEAEEARAPHVADRAPTEDEEKAAGDRHVDEDVREHYQEMTELGARDPGEGRIP